MTMKLRIKTTYFVYIGSRLNSVFTFLKEPNKKLLQDNITTDIINASKFFLKVYKINNNWFSSVEIFRNCFIFLSLCLYTSPAKNTANLFKLTFWEEKRTYFQEKKGISAKVNSCSVDPGVVDQGGDVAPVHVHLPLLGHNYILLLCC